LEVEATDAAVNIEHFTSKVKSRADAAFHCFQSHLSQRHTAGRCFGNREATVTNNGQRHLGDQPHQPPSRLFGDIAGSGAARLLAEQSCEPFGEMGPQNREPASTTGITQLSVECFR
jgi:hypothetical protein